MSHFDFPKRYLAFFSWMSLLLSVGFFSWTTYFQTREHPPFVPGNDQISFETTLPKIPERECSIEQYGALGDGVTLNTQAIQKAIESCAQQGGGTVRIPEGIWLTGPIHLRSFIALALDENAELRFSQNFSDYLPVVFSRYEGMELFNYSPLIYAKDCSDIAITGQGALNGQGSLWWDWKIEQQFGTEKLYRMADENVPVEQRIFGTTKDALRPSFIQFVNCSRILLEGFTIKNGPMWTIHPIYSSQILMQDITVETLGVNNDGIVIDSSSNIIIDHASLDTEDDAIVIKSGLDRDGWRVGRPSEHIIIRNCRVGRGNGGVVIGSEMSGDVRDVSVSDCVFDGTKRGIRIKSARGRGGIVEKITVENITMHHIESEAILFDMEYASKNSVIPTTDAIPIFRDITLRNIQCTDANTAIAMRGLQESPLRGVVFENIHMKARNGIEASFLQDSRFERITIEAKDRPFILFEQSKSILFEGITKSGKKFTF